MAIEVVEGEIGYSFQKRCERLLAAQLAQSEFHYTVCPSAGVVHIGWYPGAKCGLCESYHAWLTVGREEVRLMSKGKLPKRVKDFYDDQMRRAK